MEVPAQPPAASRHLPQNSQPLQHRNGPTSNHSSTLRRHNSNLRARANSTSESELHPSPTELPAYSHSSSHSITPSKIIKPSKSSQWKSTWITNWWGLELACWLIAAVSLVSIVIMLEMHDNKPLPNWPLDLTLNSYISIFATIAQMTMMKPVAECISQLKWLWFVMKEKLLAFEAFDDASRGPTGSLILLGKLRGLHLVSLGAAITIISAAFGPFAQQVVSYPSRLQPVGAASAQSVVHYTGSSDLAAVPVNGSSTTDIAGGSNGEIIAALVESLGNGAQNLSAISPLCSTGNCTWNEYSSLGMCATVTDLSTEIIQNYCNQTTLDASFEALGPRNPGFPCYNYTLPYQGIKSIGDGSTGIPETAFGNVSLSNLELQSLLFKPSFTGMPVLNVAWGISSSVTTWYMIYQPTLASNSSNHSLPLPFASRVTLDFCIHTYNTTVSGGQTNTTIKSSQIVDLGVTKELLPQGFIAWDSNSHELIAQAQLSATNQNFTINILAAMDLATSALASLAGLCFLLIDQAGSSCELESLQSVLNAMMNSTDPGSVLSELMDNIAITLTNTFRTGAGGDASVVYVEGLALAPVGFVQTQYLWLLLPIALVSLTFVFLLATILKSQRLGSRVWKSSNLATLQGLQIDLHAKLGGLSSIKEMEERVENIQVQFDMEGGRAEHGVDYRLAEVERKEAWLG